MDIAVLAGIIFVGILVAGAVSASVLGVLPASITGNTSFGKYVPTLVTAALVAGVVVLAAKTGLGSKIRAAV